MTIEDVKETIDQIAVNLPMSYQNKQKLLEAVSLNDRYEILGALLGSRDRSDPYHQRSPAQGEIPY